MAFTVTSVIDTCISRYRDLDRTTALAYLQQIHTDLLTEIRILADTEDVPLVAETRLYALDTDILKVWGAELYKSSTDSISIKMVSIRDLDKYTSRWHTTSSGQPTEMYQEHTSAGARRVGFYPVPNAALVTAYPNVRMYVARNQTLGEASSTTSLPESVFEPDVYRFGVWKKHASISHPEDQRAHEADYAQAKAKLKLRETNLLADVYPRNDPPYVQIARPL